MVENKFICMGDIEGELLLETEYLTTWPNIILVVMVIDFEDNIHLQVVEMTTNNNATIWTRM